MGLSFRRGVSGLIITVLPVCFRVCPSKFLTQVALAEKLGLGKQSVSYWENGKNQPSMDNLKKLCELFGVEPNDILLPEPKKGRPGR